MAQDTGTPAPSQLDAAVLVYKESGGRVTAIEPTLNATLNTARGGTFTFGLVSDSLTGASPNGAVPSTQDQTFETPTITKSKSVSVSGASGGGTIVQIPGGATVRQFTVAPGQLPLDKAFKDQREGGSIGWAQPAFGLSKVGVGAGFSTEFDYKSYSGNASIAEDFNTKNTTVSLAVNYEYDTISPYGGTPTPLTSMSGALKGPDESKRQTDFVLGVTQLLNRYWLMQLNYSYGTSDGYMNDPYRILSRVDPVTGLPGSTASNVYESRPDSRQRQSLFFDNKIAIGPNVVDASYRYYTDDWGIHAHSAEFSDRLTLTRALYVEPSIRWYRQSAADFYRYFLVNGQALPAYASSDTRLGKFSAMTYGMKVGLNLTRASEIYLRAAYYVQSGDGHPAVAIGQLKQQDLFSEVKAVSVMAGYTWVLN